MIEEYSFGSWIRRRRKALDLTQQELARRINCSLSTIVKIESDQRRPSRQIAELLAEHLSIPRDQWDPFVKVARGLKPVDRIPVFPVPLEPLPESSTGKATCILPVPPTPLVGRKHELAEVIRLITLPDCRLLTITGPGGVGKTRLALQVVHELKAASPSPFPDGVCFVSLASVAATEFIPKAIAGAIKFDLSGPLSPEEQLRIYLQNKRTLLLLDNAEHLLEGAETLTGILESTSGVKILVTSRERLNVASEWVFDLHGLPVPPIDADEDLEEYSAAKLLLDRIQQAQTGFLLEENEGPFVTQICQMLDGMPLGIELAAAWIRVLTLDEIAVEIERDPDFLTSSTRDFPTRHRSLRKVFDHSWNLLAPAEKQALRQLSAFQAGFTREAAQTVTETSLLILNSLIDKSLLRRSEPTRYDLHELIRRYAAERLADEPKEDATVQDHHSHFYLSMLRDKGQDLQSNRQKEALTMLSSELANIRSAWACAVAHDQIELLRGTAWSLWYLFDLLNYYREGEVIFADAAGMVRRNQKKRQAETGETELDMSAGALGQFLMHQAYFAMRLGKVDEAEALCQASISLLRSVDDPEALAHALTYYAVLNWTIGIQDRAWSLLQESLPLSKKHGPPWQIALFTGILGIVAYERGKYEYSYQSLSEALERSQVIGDPRLIGFISSYLGRTAYIMKRTSEIEEYLWEGAKLTQESGDRFGFGLILEQLALAAWTREDFTSAEKFFNSSVVLFREIGDTWYLSRTLISWGKFRQFSGDLAQAADCFRQAVRLSLDARALLISLNALIGLAEVYAREDKAESALEIAIRVIEHPASSQDARTQAKVIQHNAESHLTPDEIAFSYQRARSRTLEEFARILL